LNVLLPKSPLSKNHQLIYFISSWLLFLFPFALYALCVIRYTLNVPIWDDFDLILHFINNFVQTPSLKERLAQLFLQHNEHRMVFERIIFILQYYLFGRVNFQYLNYLGNLGWLLSVAFLAYIWKDRSHSFAIDLLPYSYLLLSFIYTESMFWASSSLPFYWSFFFTLLFIYFLIHDSLFLICALFGLVLFTTGGGLVLVPLAWVYLLIKHYYRHLVIFALYSLVTINVYFYHYTWAQTNQVLFSLANLPLYLKYWLTFLGASLELLTHIPGIGLVCGAIGCLLMVILWFKSPQDDFTWLLLSFVLLVAAEAALLRSSLGIGQALSTRYAQYSMLFWCCLIFISVRTFSNHLHVWFPFFTLLTALLFFRYALITQELNIFKELATSRSASICFFQSGYSYGLLYPDEVRARKILFLSRSLDVYDYKSVECAPLERDPGYRNLAPSGRKLSIPAWLQRRSESSQPKTFNEVKYNLLPSDRAICIISTGQCYFHLEKEMDLIPCVSKT
jgi:hypothetical protein